VLPKGFESVSGAYRGTDGWYHSLRGVLTPTTCFNTATFCSTENRLPLPLGRVLLRRILPEARSQAVSFRGADQGKVESTLRYLLGAGQKLR
jgi:hypothetical protein